ncbi:MAG: hypothetical protein AB7K86_07880 [Rhodospirillales bacterium]
MPTLTLMHDDAAAASFVPENETAPATARGPDDAARARRPLRAVAGAVGAAATFVVVVAVCAIAIVTHVARAALRRRPAPALPAATRLNAGA